MTKLDLNHGLVLSKVRASTAAARRIGDGVVIAGALAATVTALLAALALFVVFGRLSHRRAEAAWATPALRSLPAGPSGAGDGADPT